MKNQSKNLKKSSLIIFVLIGLALICLLTFIFFSQRYFPTYERNAVRPNDFPQVLIAPENAESVDYSSPSSNSRRAPDTYRISFAVKEPYPADNIRQFIQTNFISHGWRKLNFTILNPTTKPLWTVDKIKTPGMEVHQWQEEWVNDKDETIKVILDYSFPQDGEKDFNSLSIYLALFGKDSWKKHYISRYKELHPEEFEGNTVSLEK